MGCYRRLRTTFPSVSPVAWSSFSTGTQSRRGTTSSTSSIAIAGPTCRCCRRRASARSRGSSSSAATGIPLGKPELRLLRQVEAVLDHPRRAPHLEHDPARADHVSAGPLLRRGAERDVRARPARHAGHVPAVHDASVEASAFKEGGIASAGHARRRSHRDDGRGAGEHVRRRRTRRWSCRCACTRSIARQRVARRCRRRARRRSTPGRLSDWVTLRFRAAPGIDVTGHHAPARHRDGRALLAVHVADQPRSREAGDADRRTRSYYATYLAKRIGPYLDARPRRGHLGAQRRRHRRRHVPAADLRHRSRARRTMFFAALDRLRTRHAGLRVRRDRSHPAHVLALLDHGHPAAARPRRREHRDAIQELYRHNDALVGRVMRAARRRRRADGDVRPRLQLVPPRRQSQRWLQREGYLR